MERQEIDAVIVGAGLAGLCCAREIHQRGGRFLLVDAADRVGGRVRTDIVDGFRLDRGFQVLLTSYPEVRRVLDLEKLRLSPFRPGAFVRCNGRFYEMADPWRRPVAAVKSLWSPIGTLSDKLRVAKLRNDSMRGTIEERWNDTETSTLELLRGYGFSPSMIDRFFKPFLGGIFLDPSLTTSSRMLRFVFRMFSTGDACLPAEGMEAIPKQLASELPPGSIRTQTTVAQVLPGSPSTVVLSTGESIQSKAVVIATDGPTASALLGKPKTQSGQSVTCMYFSAPSSPVDRPILVLNGDGGGPINNLCVPTDVTESYGGLQSELRNHDKAASKPNGGNSSNNSMEHNRSLISVTTLNVAEDPERLRAAVVEQLTRWYGEIVSKWKHLKTYNIPYALPTQFPSSLTPPQRTVRVQPSLYVCGDHVDNASINGAMVSGYRAADALMQEISAS